MIRTDEKQCGDATPMLLFCMVWMGVVGLNTVEPIRDMNMVLDIADYLRSKSERNYLMFMFGIYSGLRICDILRFKVRDVRDKDYVYLRERKTGKEKRFIIHGELKSMVREYTDGMKDYEYLFPSRKGRNQPITRQQAYAIMKDAAQEFGLDNIGTHTMRKTWGYHLYQQTHDAVTIMQILNHSDISVTLRYIGINQDNKDKVMGKLSFKRR